MMTLDEAIKHCEEVAESENSFCNPNGFSSIMIEHKKCAKEHEQLAEWLKELRDYREGKRTCENCKHQDKTELDFPCSVCRCNHPNKFEWKETKNDTQD